MTKPSLIFIPERDLLTKQLKSVSVHKEGKEIASIYEQGRLITHSLDEDISYDVMTSIREHAQKWRGAGL